jgi:tripartite-type tricarboxylate transporter receptor subunit TctC
MGNIMLNAMLRVARLIVAIAIPSIACVAEAQAPAYPNKTVRIIVAAAPGGTSDILARTIGQELSKKWGQPVVVENKPGADSNVGADFVAKSPPDGYTLILLDMSTLTMGPSLYKKLSYDPAKDFAPITMIVFSPHAMFVHPSVPANNVKELIAWGKANPGKLNFASSSNAIRLAQAQFTLATGVEMLHVPYKGGAASITAVAGGEANVSLNGLLATLPHIKGGKVKGIATASSQRMEASPDLPTIIEGGVPDFVTGSWQGLLAPANTPPDIVKKINADVVAIIKSPEMKAKLTAMGADVIGDSPEDFAKFMRDDTAKWSKVAKQAGINPE